MKNFLLLFTFFLISGGAAPAQKQVQAYGRVFIHKDGSRTETQKMGDSSRVRQDTYNKDNVLTEVRIFKVDEEGRLKNGVIYDGRQNPVGSTRYFYDPYSNQLLMEELYNKNGILVRKLYYPGALKDPKFAKRMVAFSFDPAKPNAKEVEIKGPVKPIVPVTQGGGEFEPGVAQGTAAPTPQEAAAAKARSGASTIPAAPAAPKRPSWLKQKSGA
ncbi:MAG: hypothetical protein V4726_08675 [Verrucomicrobiota bacterium]